jgi:hypothetical protein
VVLSAEQLGCGQVGYSVAGLVPRDTSWFGASLTFSTEGLAARVRDARPRRMILDSPRQSRGQKPSFLRLSYARKPSKLAHAVEGKQRPRKPSTIRRRVETIPYKMAKVPNCAVTSWGIEVSF